MKSSELVVLLLLAYLASNQPVCYVSCGNGGCLSSNALACTQCDVGTVLINQRCAISGSQSDPIRILSPNAFNALDVSFLPSQEASRPQIQCNSSSQSGIMTYLNVTRSKSQVYTYRLSQILLNSPHQFVNIKFNAILFNRRNNPSIKVLIIDSSNRRIYDNAVFPNQTALTCSASSAQIPSSNAFYVVINLPSSTQNLLFQITTQEPGDELGLADIQFFYGNCDLGCATCQGPGSKQCLTCSNLLTFNSVQKSCTGCPSRFYLINSMCYPCPYNCETCSLNVSSGNPYCTKCQSSISLNGTTPSCQVNNYVSVDFQPIRFNDTEGWQSTSVLTNLATVCGSYSLLGGLPSGLGGSTIFKVFTGLPVHSRIWIKFTLFLIDQVTGSTYGAFIDVDGKRVSNYSTSIDSSIMNTSECGTEAQQFVSTVMISDIAHSSENATIKILGLGNYFGIRDFILGVINLTQTTNCAQINSTGQCTRCKNGYAVAPPAIDKNNPQAICSLCPDRFYQKNGTCLPCPIYCNTCQASANTVMCTSCDLPFKYDKNTSSCNDEENNLYTVGLSQQWENLTNQGWHLYPRLQSRGIDFCGQYSILGSTQLLYRSLSIKRIFSKLPPHQGITIHIFFYQIDDYDGIFNNKSAYSVSFLLDELVIRYTPSSSGYDICGNSTYDSIQKLVLTHPTHQGDSLMFEIRGNNTKLGISNLLLFLQNCDCKDNGVGYQLQTIPIYSVETDPNTNDRGLKSKIIFSEKVRFNSDLKNVFDVKLTNITNETIVGQQPKATGEKNPFEILTAELYASRELRMLQNLIKDQYSKYAIGSLVTPEVAYGFVNQPDGEILIKNMRLKPVTSNFSRYDDLHLDANGSVYRANIRNLMNLFRGISILALFIGLISFFFGLSYIFDDLFVMCQIIFVHLFIKAPWVPATMQLPVGAMNLVQFMAWLPIEARNGIQKGIIPPDHYQRSPIIYEQYWKDVTFARAIYHTVIFLAAMFILFWLIRIIKILRAPTINNLMDLTKPKLRFIQSYYYSYSKHWFVFIDQVIRFTFFTVMWAACLQFISFYNEPSGFMVWNSVLCICMFVAYIAYIFIGYFYFKKQAQISQNVTFLEKFGGIRLKKTGLIYFVFKYLKWVVIAFLIGQLYKFNPLATLIPLIAIHLLDGLVITFINPYIEDMGESERIVSKCTKYYWIFYRISHIIENALFVILEVIMIIMHASSNASKESYLSIGYACCAFIIMMFINGLLRVVWGFIRSFEFCYEQLTSRDQEIKSEEELDPLKFQDIYRANAVTLPADLPQANNTRRPSIEGQMGR